MEKSGVHQEFWSSIFLEFLFRNLIPKQTDISKKESEQTQKSKQEEAQNTTSQGPDQNATVTEEKQPDETTEEQKNKSAVEGDVSGDKTQNPDQTPQGTISVL